MTDFDRRDRPEPPVDGDELATLTGFLEFHRATLATGDLGQLSKRAPWPDGRNVSLRWILTHMVEEYSRHNGHADLLREAIDGQVGE